jgi:hypothetical protein
MMDPAGGRATGLLGTRYIRYTLGQNKLMGDVANKKGPILVTKALRHAIKLIELYGVTKSFWGKVCTRMYNYVFI